MTKLILLSLAALVALGGYYGYSHFQAAKKQTAFAEKVADLRMELMRLNKTVRPDDVRALVIKAAKESDLETDAGQVTVSIEALNEATQQRLPEPVGAALSIAAKMPNHQTPPWVIGFRASLVAKHGLVSVPFDFERYTYFEDAQP